jgi:hypothetical protein
MSYKQIIWGRWSFFFYAVAGGMVAMAIFEDPRVLILGTIASAFGLAISFGINYWIDHMD